MNAIETRGLTKRYGKLTALKELTLSVPEGEIFALLGVNGAGKTTAIKLLTGLTAPTEGDALILGHSVVADTRGAKALVGISPQETAVAPRLTVLENLELMCGLYSLPDAKGRAREMAERFSLTAHANQYASTLSGGWSRRLSIAMALMSGPRVLFLDEPTLGLDVLARRELWRVVRELPRSVTVILTTHYLEEAEALSDRIGILLAGQLRAVGSVSELCKLTGADSFEDAFLRLAGGVAS